MTPNYPLTAEEFETIYSKVPRVTVEVVIIQGDDIVLVKRGLESWKGQWRVPGGTVHYKEPLEEAVKRIAQEELAISVRVFDLLGYIEYPSEEKERGFGWPVALAFLCRTSDPIPALSQLDEEVELFKTLPDNMVQEQRTFLSRVCPEFKC